MNEIKISVDNTPEKFANDPIDRIIYGALQCEAEETTMPKDKADAVLAGILAKLQAK